MRCTGIGWCDVSLWTTPAHPSPFPPQPGFDRLLAELRAADPTGERLRALIAEERAEADRPLSQPLTAAALHTPIR